MMEETLDSWFLDLFKDKPLLMAGPCSAETKEQMLSTAEQLKERVDFFRAGVWKPRTRPGGFEGVGEIGIKWLAEVKKNTGLKTATEVANKDHARLAIEGDVDLLWIGARTTVSPFVVQEIAHQLRGTDKIVLVKNPVSPDLSLWIGAIERLQKEGIEKIGAIHRGFSVYEKTIYRNDPQWQIPIELKERFPKIPIICDPSHIAGKRELIQELSQRALDFNFNGLMIETHCNPDQAWSDATQQITPQRFFEIVGQLKVRRKKFEAEEFEKEIKTMRCEIDAIDQKIVELLGKRMEISDKIGKIKMQNNVCVLQRERWNQIMKRATQMAKEKGVTPEFIEKIFKAIHQESIDRQKGQ